MRRFGNETRVRMPHLPLNIDMHDRIALIAGGGQVAYRKMQVLLASGACVRVVAPVVMAEITDLAASGAVSVREGCYQTGDLDNISLAVAATSDTAVNRQVAEDARQRGILVAVADDPQLGTCTFPALLRRGDLEISVSTGGRCPAFAVLVRDVLAGVIGNDYGVALERLAAQREKLLTEGNDSTYNNKIIRSLAARLITELTEHKESP